jgi:ribosomal protein L11 methyltransferase
MAYLVYTFKVQPPQPGTEILIAHLAELGFESFESNEDGFKAYAKEESVKAFLPVDYSFEDFNYSFKIEKLEKSNWNEEWEKNFEPVKVGQSLIIRAPFHESDKKFAHEIVIMPKMSFGTGHHQTTRLMCAGMLETDFKNKKVLDMGCGTGILAILAMQLGAREVLGIDIDEWSVNNSVENCKMNGYPEIRILKGDAQTLQSEHKFDCVLANINKNILKADLPEYGKHMNPGAIIFLSGFFITDQDELKEVASNSGLDFLKISSEQEWACLLFRKN